MLLQRMGQNWFNSRNQMVVRLNTLTSSCTARFLNLSTINIWGQIILYFERCSVTCRILSGIFGLSTHLLPVGI